ncbi:hypothetical protein PT974_04628 [Cladobotryum mycophilum]|uniref:Uncharacterized protein n=1 Tax=Cladobotryum mycophilum TaxID=491253 RepID=A0ABR0SW07_9HYPO
MADIETLATSKSLGGKVPISLATTSDYDIQPLEFVTFSGGASSTKHSKGASKVVRAQAMRNYVWKQNHPSLAHETRVGVGDAPQKPSHYKGRYKLNQPLHTAKKGIKSARQRRQHIITSATTGTSNISDGSGVTFSPLRKNSTSCGPIVLLGGQFDPLDSFSLHLGPESQELIFYYHQAFSMNSVALDIEADCLFYSAVDLALFHSVLYMIAAERDLRTGTSDSAASLHHGGEAFRLINQHLQDGALHDTTIAAIAIIATRENLNGRFDLSDVHMTGLELMIKKRGGIKNIKGIHRRIVTWSDFCCSATRYRQPRFARLPITTERSIQFSLAAFEILAPEDVFGVFSPIVPVFESLRQVSLTLNAGDGSTLDRATISLQIYNIEYDVLLLKESDIAVVEPNRWLAPEATLLKIASHLYLYLVIRDLPTGSSVFQNLVGRLQAVLEGQNEAWWELHGERQNWLLWILFMGYGAAGEREEKWWFVRNLMLVCRNLGIIASDELTAALRRILWREAWCKDCCQRLWKDFLTTEQI